MNNYSQVESKRLEENEIVKSRRASNPIYSLLPTEVEGFDSLAEVALDLRWSWSHSSDELWEYVDPTLWELTHNPWVVLQTVHNGQRRGFQLDWGFTSQNVRQTFRAKVSGALGERLGQQECASEFHYV